MNVEKFLEIVWFSWADWIMGSTRILLSDMVQRPQYLWSSSARDPSRLYMNIWRKWTVEYRVSIRVKYHRLNRKGRFFEAAKVLHNM